MSDVSVPQSWPMWAHSVSHTRVTVERGIKFGIDQNRDAAANCWRLAPWLMPAARRRHPRFSAIFDRLFDRLPVRISTSDLHHWILRKKIFHIRAFDFGVQFSFKVARNEVENTSFAQRSAHRDSRIWRPELIEPAEERKRRARADDDRRSNRPTPTHRFCHSAIFRPITPYNVWFFWISRHRSIILATKMETFSGRFWEIPGNVLKLELLKMFIDHKNASVFFQAVSGMSSWSFSYRWTKYQWEKKQLLSISSSRF